MTLNVLSLFAGIGGLELGLERAGMTTVGQVEINPFCQQVLAQHWPGVPRHDDVRTAVQWWQSEPRPAVDVVCGGFPCQDISNAGGRAGITGARSGLWREMAETVCAVRPSFVLVENVAVLASRGLDVVLGDLAQLGFDAEWGVVSACSVGAPHMRKRLFILAHPPGFGREWRWGDRPNPQDVEPQGRGPEHGGPWSVEPRPVGVAYGVPSRVDRLHALGNAVVPQVAELIGRQLMQHSLAGAA